MIAITRNRSLSNIGRARCAAINSDFKKIIISKYINYYYYYYYYYIDTHTNNTGAKKKIK